MSARSQLLAMIVCMMTHELEVSILAAPLAQMDPRALSQAWYTALRLAPKSPMTGARPAALHAAPSSHTQRSSARVPQPAPGINGSSPAAAREQFRRPPAAFDAVTTGVRRAPRSELAERIERAFGGPPLRNKRATFSLGRGNARVHIVLQTIGERPTLLALCRPEVRTIVGRALSEARLALARRGIGLQLCALGEAACS